MRHSMQVSEALLAPLQITADPAATCSLPSRHSWMWFATLQSTQTGREDTLTQHTKIAVFHLPELTAADQKDLKLAASAVPEKNEDLIRLMSPTEARRASAAAIAPNVITVGPAGTRAQMAAEDATQGDATREQPRKKPSLYDPGHPPPP